MQVAKAPASESSHDAPVRHGLGTLVVTLACSALVGFGWMIRAEGYLRADSGLGYRLGIAGATMLGLLLLYSARRRMRALSGWGPVRYWFRVHMWLGISAPIAILFHCNFQLGSLNSTVALITILLVAASGLAGRFVYAKVHHGLYGRRARLRERRLELTEANGKLRPLLEVFPEVLEPLHAFEERNTRSPRGAIASVWRLATIGLRCARMRMICASLLEPVLDEERRAAYDYVARVRRIAELAAWERLFRLWHAVHVPLFVMLVLTVLVHVVAVHMY